jgi:hypothetical protein
MSRNLNQFLSTRRSIELDEVMRSLEFERAQDERFIESLRREYEPLVNWLRTPHPCRPRPTRGLGRAVK